MLETVTGCRLYRPSTRSFVDVEYGAEFTKNEVKLLISIEYEGWEVFRWFI